MLPGDRLICVFLKDRESGGEFTAWPLHITIVPWFRSEISSDELTEEIHDALQDIGKFDVTVDGEVKIGYRERKSVHLIETPSPTEIMERQTRQLLHEHQAWIVDETTKIRREFRPHITVQTTGSVQPGDKFTCDKLYIVEQKGDHKEIVSRIEL